MSGDPIRAAGGVVRRLDADGTPRVLLMHRPRYDDWSLPKGKREIGERTIDTALREVGEEAGIRVRVERKLPLVEYVANGSPKSVRYFLMAWTGDAPELRDDEADELRWCTVDEARRLLSYEHDVPLLDAIDPATRPGTVWVIRHAKAGSRTRFAGNDVERPLTDAGRRQAATLATSLGAEPIAWVLSSPYRRCLETVAPLAATLGTPVTTVNGLAEGQPVNAVWQWCAQPEPVALCTHGDLLEDMLWSLARADKIEPEATEFLGKGSIWRLETVGGSVVRADYSPPPAKA